MYTPALEEEFGLFVLFCFSSVWLYIQGPVVVSCLSLSACSLAVLCSRARICLYKYVLFLSTLHYIILLLLGPLLLLGR